MREAERLQKEKEAAAERKAAFKVKLEDRFAALATACREANVEVWQIHSLMLFCAVLPYQI